MKIPKTEKRRVDVEGLGEIDAVAAIQALVDVRNAYQEWGFCNLLQRELDEGLQVRRTRLDRKRLRNRDTIALAYRNARDRFEAQYGPLYCPTSARGDSQDFEDAMKDIVMWVVRSSLGVWPGFPADDPETEATLEAIVRDVQAAIQSVVPRLDGSPGAPTLYAALCYIAEYGPEDRIRFYLCRECRRLFAPRRNDDRVKFCGNLCRQRSYDRRQREAKQS